MKLATNGDCPPPQTLLEFLQGRLTPPELNVCETHVSDCDSCHETLRGLDANDTLSQYVSEAIEIANEPADSDSAAIDGLLQRLLNPQKDLQTKSKTDRRRKFADAEVMADRAAEVLRCIEPAKSGDKESLGSLGDYQLLRLIGAGGTGVVFQAKDRSLNRLVALKVLRPSLGSLARDRFMAEARLAASIEHDNIVTIYQIGQQDRLAFIAMQWFPGETLESRLLRENGSLNEKTVRSFIGQIAAGLSAAHARQLIHRDIKPANIWICEETQRIKILDFGLARVTDEDSSFTQTGMLAGTPNFMSPEQARGLELDPRSDLFSLGCVMYQMLTGKLTFSAPTILATLQTIQSETPPSPMSVRPNCDEDLSDLTMSLLEKLPGNRLASADDLIACLDAKRENWPQSVSVAHVPEQSDDKPELELAKQEPLRTPEPAVPMPSVSSPPRSRWIIAACLLGAIGFFGWLAAPQIFRIATDQGELVIETDDPNIKIEVLEDGQVIRTIDTSTSESFDVRSGNYVFNAIKEGSNSQFTITPKSVTMTRGGKEVVTVTKAKPPLQNQQAASSEQAEKFAPFYGGRTFDEWMHIAKNDREPKTVAEAIAACAVLADGERKPLMIEFLRKMARQHGRFRAQLLGNGGNESSLTDVYFTGFMKSLNQLDPSEVVEFIQTEIESGNAKSLGFCSGVFSYAYLPDDLGKQMMQFHEQKKFDLNPLVRRILNDEIRFMDVQMFFDAAFTRAKTTVDLTLCKKVLRDLKVHDRPWSYRTFMVRFGDGQFDEMIMADFFAESTPGKVREIFLASMLQPHMATWEPSFHVLPSKNHLAKLANSILMQSIERTLDVESAIDFGTLAEFNFDDGGEVTYFESNGFGSVAGWQTSRGFLSAKPANMERVTGRAAVLRHLLSKLCANVGRLKNEQNSGTRFDFTTVAAFAERILESELLADSSIDSAPLLELKIQQDLKSLADVPKEEEPTFSRFVVIQNPSGMGGMGGGGMGGGVF